MSGSDGVFNIAKGRVTEFYNRVESNDPTNSAFIVVVLEVAEADDTLNNYDDLSALLAASNTEATSTNYTRKTLTDTELSALPAPDDTNNWIDLDIPDQTWTSVSQSGSESWVKLLVCYDSDTTGGTDANIIPCTYHSFDVTPDGTDIVAQINASGYYRAA